MFASCLRRVAQKIRHAPGLRSLSMLWDWVRPRYARVLSTLGEKGVRVLIVDCPMLISPKFASTAWESVEHAGYEEFARTIRPGDVVYDVGAHIGTYTMVALQKSAPGGRVVAYEPADLTRDFLVRHLQWNNAGNRVIVRPCCCGAQETNLYFYSRDGEVNGDSGLVPLLEGRRAMVRVRTLDSEIAELALIPRVIKVDVEGWEFEVLKGAESILTEHHPVLFLSLHPNALAQLQTTPATVQGWLKERGYACRVISSDHEIHVAAIPKKRGQMLHS